MACADDNATARRAHARYHRHVGIDPTWLVLSLIPGGIGFVLLVLGKKQGRIPHIVAGLAFMVYPYFFESVLGLVGVGLLIGAGFWLAVRAGW